MTDRDQMQVGLERPAEYSDAEWAAYKAGAAAMMEFVGQMHLSMAAEMAGQVDVPDASSNDDEDEEHPEECPDCGMDLVYQMGSETGQCPDCDLL